MQQGRVVVVTGAGGGIGSKIADRFLANDDRVIGLDKDEPSMKELAATRKAGDQLSISFVDIADAEAVVAFAKRVQQTHGHVDVLVNCAGFYPVVPFELMKLTQWQEVIRYQPDGHLPDNAYVAAVDEGPGLGTDCKHRFRIGVRGSCWANALRGGEGRHRGVQSFTRHGRR